MSSKVLFMELSSSNLLLLTLRNFIKFSITVQATTNIESVCGAPGHGGFKDFFTNQERQSENSSEVIPSSRLDFLKALVKAWSNVRQFDCEPQA